MDRPDPSMVLMAAVLGVRDNSDFKVSLVRDPPLDLGEFFHEAERFLRQEDACLDMRPKEVNTTKDGGLPGKSSGGGEDKGKRKRWGEPKFST